MTNKALTSVKSEDTMLKKLEIIELNYNINTIPNTSNSWKFINSYLLEKIIYNIQSKKITKYIDKYKEEKIVENFETSLFDERSIDIVNFFEDKDKGLINALKEIDFDSLSKEKESFDVNYK